MRQDMRKADEVRLWNARRGVARAAHQLGEVFDKEFDVLQPLDSILGHLMANLSGAIDELHAAEGLIPPSGASCIIGGPRFETK